MGIEDGIQHIPFSDGVDDQSSGASCHEAYVETCPTPGNCFCATFAEATAKNESADTLLARVLEENKSSKINRVQRDYEMEKLCCDDGKGFRLAFDDPEGDPFFEI